MERDFVELAALLGETVRGLKRVGPPPAQLRDAVQCGSLGDRHMPAVLALALAGPMSVSELARRLGLELSSTSAIVGQLSRAGLVDRTEDEADRRRTIVRVHDDFHDLLAAWTREALRPLHRTLERLPPAHRAHFMEGWRLLHEEATRDS